MLVIRLLRIGKINQPVFKIVVTDKRNPPRGGVFVEDVGFLNSGKKERALKVERIKYWLSVGAKPSDTIYNMLVSEKIIEGKKIPLHKKSKKKEEEKAPAIEKPTETPRAEAPVETPKEKAPAEIPKEEIKEEKAPEAETKTE